MAVRCLVFPFPRLARTVEGANNTMQRAARKNVDVRWVKENTVACPAFLKE
jgi:hypothetical protein